MLHSIKKRKKRKEKNKTSNKKIPIAANRAGGRKRGRHGKKKKKEKRIPESITSVLLPVLFKTHVPSLTVLWLVENMTATSMVCGLHIKKTFFGTAEFGY